MIFIYTDASCNRKRNATAASCLILKDGVFVSKKEFKLDTNLNTLYAEVWGAVQAIEHAAAVCDDFEAQGVILYTDSLGCMDSSKYIHEGSVEQYELDVQFQSLLRKYNIRTELIHGHSVGHNPNKIVDKFASRAIRK